MRDHAAETEGQGATGHDQHVPMDERLRLLIDSAIDYAIVTISPDGRIDSWNPGAERMFGYSAVEAIGLDAAILFTPEDRAAGVPEQELGQAARSGRAEDERWHLRKNGERFYCSGVTTRLGHGALRGFAKIARDLTERKQHETALREMREQLEARVQERTAQLRAEADRHAAAKEHVTQLLGQIVTAQEDERARIARDLHDQLGQLLTALRLSLERHQRSCTAGDAAPLEQALQLTSQIDSEVDFLAWVIRPAVLDDLGVTAALARLGDGWASHYGVEVHFQAIGVTEGRLSRQAETAFYRIAQEALTNAVRHGRPGRVDILLEARGPSLVLIIEDDGIGFDVAEPARKAGGIGIAGMRERAALIGGHLLVESMPDHGTTVFLTCPIDEGGAA